MGITGLLPLMKNASTEISLSKLQDTVAAVDTNVWIHRACYSCADKIYLNESTELFINYCINYCKLLQKFNITPILIFDGQNLPAKSETKLERKKRKEEIRKQVEELLRRGKESEARWLMRQCVDVTFEMIQKVIERCRKENIDYIVAPYEADAQITYLVNNNIADYAITEDSDLLAFGCRRALYKLDRDTARGRMIDLDRLDRCFKNFNFQKFQYMCILSGCDYLTNIPGVAIGRSKKFFETLSLNNNNNYNLNDIEYIIKLLPIILNMAHKIKIPENYIEDFKKALNTFNYQIIYSPLIEDFTHLNALKKDIKHEQLSLYAGDFFDEKLKSENQLDFVKNYIIGNICPKTLKFIDNYNPLDLENGEKQQQQFWKSKLIIDRIETINKNNKIDKFFDSNRIYRNTKKPQQKEENNGNAVNADNDDDGDVKIINDNDIPIYPKDLKSKRKFNEQNSFTTLKNHSDSLTKSSSSTSSTKPRLTRNMFRKFNKNENNSNDSKDNVINNNNNVIKSKYFQTKNQSSSDLKNQSSDELEFLDLLPETKKTKPNLNKSVSSIEDDDDNDGCQFLMELKSKHNANFRKRSGSLSSTQTQSTITTTSQSSTNSEQSSQHSSNDFETDSYQIFQNSIENKLSKLASTPEIKKNGNGNNTRKLSTKKQSSTTTTSINRRSNRINESKDIRSFFNFK